MNSNFRYSFVILPTGSDRAEYTYDCETLAQHNSIKEELLDRMAKGSIKGFSAYKLIGRYVGASYINYGCFHSDETELPGEEIALSP